MSTGVKTSMSLTLKLLEQRQGVISKEMILSVETAQLLFPNAIEKLRQIVKQRGFNNPDWSGFVFWINDAGDLCHISDDGVTTRDNGDKKIDPWFSVYTWYEDRWLAAKGF